MALFSNSLSSRFHRSIKSLDPASLFYLSLSVLALAICFLIIAVFIQHRTPVQKQASVPLAGLPQQTVVTMGNVEMELLSVKTSAGQPGFTAPEGKQYVVVDFRVKNLTEQPINVLPSSETYIKDDAGNVSYLTPYGIKNPFHAGELPAGEQVHGELSYLASKTGNPKFYVDAIWSGGVVPFVIKR